MSQQDRLGSVSQAPRNRASGTRGTTDIPTVGQRGGGQGPDSEGIASRSWAWVCGATPRWLHGRAGGTGEGSLNRALLPAGDSRGGWGLPGIAWLNVSRALLKPRDGRNCSFFWWFGYASGGTKRKENKRFSTRPSHHHHHLPKICPFHLWVARLRAACTSTCRLVWQGPGRAAEEAAGGNPRRWAGGVAAAGGRVKAAAGCRGRICLIASVCFWASENCWAKLSTALPKRPAWEIGESRKQYLSVSRISPGSATDGDPDLGWPSSDLGSVQWLSSLSRRDPSPCAALASTLSQNYPRATPLIPWPGILAGVPWRAGWRQPVQRHRTGFNRVEDLWSRGAPNEMARPPYEEPTRSPGSPTACGVLEEWGAHRDALGGFAPTVTLSVHFASSAEQKID